MALLTRAQLAEELQISPRTVQNLEKRGLPVVRVGADPRYDLDEVRLWMGNPVMSLLFAYVALEPKDRRVVDTVLHIWREEPDRLAYLREHPEVWKP